MFSLLLVLESEFIPKRKGPTDLQTLHSRNVMHQSRWGPCKMPCAVQCARCYMQYSTATHILYWKGCDYGLQCGQSTLSYLLCLISALSHLYVMGRSGVDCTAWLGQWGTLMLWCTVWLVVNWYLDALCGWNTQMYPVLMHWCALWLMMNSIDDYIAICTAHTLIAWCVFCFSKHYNASIHMLLKIEWRVKNASVNR